MKALLDVVRAQHTATEGSEERPFDINDIIDMALNITGRPEEPEEQQELSDTIQKLAESLAPRKTHWHCSTNLSCGRHLRRWMIPSRQLLQ